MNNNDYIELINRIEQATIESLKAWEKENTRRINNETTNVYSIF